MNPHKTLAAAAVLASVVVAGSLVWRARAQPEPMASPITRIATVDAVGLLEVMLETDETFEAEREELRQAISDNLEDVRGEIERIQQEAQQRVGNDPELQALQQQFRRATQRLSQVEQESAQRVQRMTSQQARRGYADIHAAIVAVAEERGLEHVMSTRRGGEIPSSRNTPTAVFQDILARSLVVAPESSDITELVRERLGLPDPSEVEAQPLPGQMGGGPGGEPAGGR